MEARFTFDQKVNYLNELKAHLSVRYRSATTVEISRFDLVKANFLCWYSIIDNYTMLSDQTQICISVGHYFHIFGMRPELMGI